MGERHHHYERAFEHYLRAHQVPFISVNDARKALLPSGAPIRLAIGGGNGLESLKSFDFVLYGSTTNLLVETKGRRLAPRRGAGGATRLESWVTHDDVRDLRVWRDLFGAGFRAAFVFIYWCDEMPPAALFEEIVDFEGRWYSIRAVELDLYAGAMRERSSRWRTVHLSTADFDRFSGPLLGSGGFAAGATE